MARIHTGLNSTKFEKPGTVTSATICLETGMRATTGCSHTYTEYFLWFTTPDLCNKHTGKELQNTKKENTESENKVKEIIQGITNEIDEKEPPRTNNPTTNTNNTNAQDADSNDKKQNTTNSNNTANNNNSSSTTNSTDRNISNSTNNASVSTNVTSNQTSHDKTNITNNNTESTNNIE